MIEPGEHVCILGITGCGKSTLTRSLALAEERVIVLDRMHEWGETDFVYVSTIEEFKKQYEENFENVRIVVRPPLGSSGEELEEFCDQLIFMVYRAESSEKRGLILVIEEVWLYAPLHGGTPMLTELLLTGRHQRISLISNSQKPALVSRLVTGQSRHIFIGQHHDPRDSAFFKEFGVPASPEKYDWYYFKAGSGLVLIKNT